MRSRHNIARVVADPGATDLDRLAELVAQRIDASRAAEIERLAAMYVELKEDIAELRGGKQPKAPAGWVNLKGAAAASGYSLESLRQWAAAGLIDAKRVGGRWIVRAASVAERSTR